MLRCLDDLGYGVEWRVINAADYGYPQRRRRTFIFAFHKTTSHYKNLAKIKPLDIHLSKGMFASEFTVEQVEIKGKEFRTYKIDKGAHNSLVDVSNEFKAQFFNSGLCFKGQISTMEVVPTECKNQTLGDICLKEGVDKKYFLNGSFDTWEYLKGAKKAPRTKPNGEPYFYTEGPMAFPDHLHLPARTILTSESSVNRSTHVIKDFVTGKLRLLTPVECERLNGFPDGWTNTGMPEKFRYFTMGNALVVPIIERIGSRLLTYMSSDEIKKQVLISA
jgi:DNA (cytosine-5)-methyltransferase 1